MNNIFDINVSGFDNYTNSTPKEVNLFTFLTSKKYSNKVDEIRSEPDKKIRDKIKATLPAITPSGIFSPTRADNNLIKHSGFICIDIDLKGNECLNNYNNLKDELCKIPNVAFCGLSVSGTGYFVLIPIKEPQHHKEYFNTLSIAFQDMNISIDKSCVNISRLRGYSYDNDYYINNDAEVWDVLPPIIEVVPPTKEIVRKQPVISYNSNNTDSTQYFFETCLKVIQTNYIDITSDYKQWFLLLGCLSNHFGEAGRQYAHIISQYHPNYNYNETDYEFTKAMTNTTKKTDLSYFFKCCKEFGVTYKPEPQPKKVIVSENEILFNLITKQYEDQGTVCFDPKINLTTNEPNYDLKTNCDTFNKKNNKNLSYSKYLDFWNMICNK